MKAKNRAIICLAAAGIIIFSIVHGVIIPDNNKKRKQYAVEQQNPITHDLKSILKYKSKYMGDASNISNLFHTLPLSNEKMYFRLLPDKLTVEVNYEDVSVKINENSIKITLIYNSTAAFALVDNLQQITYNFKDSTYKVMRSDVEKWYGYKLSNLLNCDEWKMRVQNKLKDSKYVGDCMLSLLK